MKETLEIALTVIILFLDIFWVWLCWNMTMPELFGLPRVTCYQSFFLIVLGRALFTRHERLKLND